jgi:hypothetical protein
VAGSYLLGWSDYSTHDGPGGRFRHLIVEVLPLGPPSPPGPETPVEEPVVPTPLAGPSAPTDTTCRRVVLAAFEALEQRHGRSDFTPAEVVAES